MEACGVSDLSTPRSSGPRSTPPRGAAARLRAGDDPDRSDLRPVVRHERAPALGGRAHAPAGRRARRILPRARQPGRPQGRAEDGAGRPPRLVRHAQSGQRARPSHGDRAHGPRPGRAPSAAADPRRAAGRPPRGLGMRSDARQHDQVEQRLQDPAVRSDPGRGAASSRCTRPRGRMPGACTSR